MSRDELDPGRVWLLHGFLDSKECAGLIRRSEDLGYEPAPVGGVILDTMRNNTRVVFEDETLATELFQRAQRLLPDTIDGMALAGFHEQFRFYRYEPGQEFHSHRDGGSERIEVWEESRLTFMIYLNDQMEGGETRFYKDTKAAFDDGPYLSVRPEQGTALVFLHQVWHAGAVVRSGRKYVLRTNVMFRGPPAESG